MGNVDLADQLRNHYRYDSSWHRNRKWWWAVWWWGYQVLLTNSYILYYKYHKMMKSSNAVSHYEYIKMIALAWVNPELNWPTKKKINTKRRLEQTEDLTRITRAKRKLYTDSVSISDSSRCSVVDNNTLHPSNGKLRCRLVTSVQHVPEVPKTKRPRCALHRWARDRSGPEVMKNVVVCSICQVNLCIPCFKIFHKEGFIAGLKDDIAAS